MKNKQCNTCKKYSFGQKSIILLSVLMTGFMIYGVYQFISLLITYFKI